MQPVLMRTLVTPRLLLEPLTAAHAADLFPVLSAEEIYRFMPQEPPVSEAHLEARYKSLERRRSTAGDAHWLNWTVRAAQEGGRPIGLVEASVPDGGAGILAYMLGPSHWGRGLGAEAVSAMMTELTDAFDVRAFEAYVDTRNHASLALLRKLGFAITRTIPEADHFKGSVSDEYHLRKEL